VDLNFVVRGDVASHLAGNYDAQCLDAAEDNSTLRDEGSTFEENVSLDATADVEVSLSGCISDYDRIRAENRTHAR
jgi:hypothetical protein